MEVNERIIILDVLLNNCPEQRDPFTREPSDLHHLGSSAAPPAECSKISRKGYGSLPSLWPGRIAEPLQGSEHCHRLLTPSEQLRPAPTSQQRHCSIRCSTTRLLNNWTASCHKLSDYSAFKISTLDLYYFLSTAFSFVNLIWTEWQ